MKITRISRQKRKKNCYSVHIDGAYAFSVTDENRVKFGLAEGKEVSPADVEGILSEDEKRRAMDYAFTYLGTRSRSRRELIDRLRREEFSSNAADHTVRRLEELGYINDGQFAREWALALKEKGSGPERVRQQLRKKGISAEIIQEILDRDRQNPEAERERIKDIARRKLLKMKNVPAEAAVRRLWGHLARRGFGMDDIRQALSDLRREIGDTQNEQD